MFLQQIWGHADWPLDRFYNPEVMEEAIARKRVEDGWLIVEISEELPDVEVAVSEIDVVLTVGGSVPLLLTRLYTPVIFSTQTAKLGRRDYPR